MSKKLQQKRAPVVVSVNLDISTPTSREKHSKPICEAAQAYIEFKSPRQSLEQHVNQLQGLDTKLLQKIQCEGFTPQITTKPKFSILVETLKSPTSKEKKTDLLRTVNKIAKNFKDMSKRERGFEQMHKTATFKGLHQLRPQISRLSINSNRDHKLSSVDETNCEQTEFAVTTVVTEAASVPF